MASPDIPPPSGKCPFIALPREIRNKIYVKLRIAPDEINPYPSPLDHAKPLAVNSELAIPSFYKALYNEGSEILYGKNY